MDKGGGRGYVERLNTDELNARVLEGGLRMYMRQPKQEKCCAVNKHRVEKEITLCSASIPHLSDTKQPVPLLLSYGRRHFVVDICHLEEVLHLVGQGQLTGRSFWGTGSLVLRITVGLCMGLKLQFHCLSVLVSQFYKVLLNAAGSLIVTVSFNEASSKDLFTAGQCLIKNTLYGNFFEQRMKTAFSSNIWVSYILSEFIPGKSKAFVSAGYTIQLATWF